jgi:hypothetical protein
MAEIIDLNINIGANTTDFESSLQKAQNLLKQFEAALKKATNVGEINYLNNQIKNLNATIATLGQQMNKVGRPAGDATNALTNLSRVAQDAPYGFIGIANNLNPLLESFQRLQKESGSSANALKSMAAGLAGPAGIGLALGVVSSLIVTYGKDISNFIAKTLDGTNAVKENAEAIKAGQEAYIKAYTEMYNLSDAFDKFNNGLISKKELLKQYNDTLGDTYGKTNSVTEAEKIWAANSDNFVKAAVLRAAALSQIDKAAKKAAEAFEAQAKPKEAFTSAFAFVGAGAGGAAPINLQAQTDKDRLANQKKVVDGLKVEEKFHLQVAKSIEQELKGLEKKAVYSEFIGKELPKETKERATQVDYGKELVKQMLTAQNASKAFMDNMKAIGLEMVKISGYTQSQENEIEKVNEGSKKFYKNKLTDLSESTQKKGGFGAMVEGMIKKDQTQIEGEDAEKKRIDDLTKSYNDFAYTISNNVTNSLMGMYEAMQSGQSPLQAIGDMFANIAKQIAAAVLQAIIFQALLEAFPALKGVFTAMGAASSGKGLGGLLGLASGGIATGPTLAMIGEGSESEAVLPLSKLGNIMQNSFNAGSMNGNSMGQNGQFVLRGQDLVLAMQRSNSSLNIIRG